MRPGVRIFLSRLAKALLLAGVYSFLVGPLGALSLASLDGRPHGLFHFPPEQLTLAHYWNIPRQYFETFWASLTLATVAAAGGCVLGVPAALGLVRGLVRGRAVIGALFRAPLQIPFVVTGVAFLQTYYLASDLVGADLAGTFLGLAVAHVFLVVPYVVGTVGASLQRFDPRLEEAALSLGAGRWSTFRRVTMPLMMPGIYAGVLYAFIVSFGDVSVALFLAGPRFTTFPVEIFQALGLDFNPAMLAISTLVALFSLGLALVIQQILGLDILLRAGARE